MARYLSFLICCLALLPQLLFSQQSADVVTSVSQERIYLQTDKPNMMAVKQLGYSLPMEFHSPQYTGESIDTHTDVRTTLYWNPSVKTGADGNASVTFFASDTSRRYLVTIEGVSDDDTIVHQQQVIE